MIFNKYSLKSDRDLSRLIASGNLSAKDQGIALAELDYRSGNVKRARLSSEERRDLVNRLSRCMIRNGGRKVSTLAFGKELVKVIGHFRGDVSSATQKKILSDARKRYAEEMACFRRGVESIA